LHLAAANGNKEMASLLLAHGADISAADGTLGETPAQWAKRMGKAEVAEFLRTYAEVHPAKSSPASSASLTSTNGERPRALTRGDGLSCAFSQDISTSLNGGLSGTMSASANHFRCKNKTGNEVEIDLISSDPNVNAGVEDGKIAIRTKMFGTAYRGNQSGTFGTYELTESQIKKLKAFLGL
jgi:hypothetical protein